jgi:peptide/nickel transport system permease protein
MIGFVVRRLLATVPVMVVIGVFVFLLLHLAPGDPAAIIAGDNATPASIIAIRHQLGLDQSILVQFLRWSGQILHGNLGISIFSEAPVLTLIGQRLAPTVSLTLITAAFSVAIALGIGVLAGWRAGGVLDRAVMAFAAIGFSVPGFVVGYGLIYLFAIDLRWLPVQGYVPLSSGVWPWFQHLILPSLTLGLAYIALIARITRTALLDVLSEDYIRTATAKGVATTPMLLHHALRNAAVPIVTVIGIGVALLIGGVVITETVFNIPGIGRLVVDAVNERDYPVVQGVILVFSGMYVLINLAVDISYLLLDPRIRS